MQFSLPAPRRTTAGTWTDSSQETSFGRSGIFRPVSQRSGKTETTGHRLRAHRQKSSGSSSEQGRRRVVVRVVRPKTLGHRRVTGGAFSSEDVPCPSPFTCLKRCHETTGEDPCRSTPSRPRPWCVSRIGIFSVQKSACTSPSIPSCGRVRTLSSEVTISVARRHTGPSTDEGRVGDPPRPSLSLSQKE